MTDRNVFYNVLPSIEVLSLPIYRNFLLFFPSQKVIISGGLFFITLIIAIGTGKSRTS